MAIGGALDCDRVSRVGLSLCTAPGDPATARAVGRYGAGAVLDLRPDPDRWRDEARTVIERSRRSGIAVVVPGDPGWPSQLADLAAPPLVLYRMGADIRPHLWRSAAVVGSRAASPDGLAVAHRWAWELAAAGVAVVSGAAFGIDAAAHHGCLAAGGTTIAVLASGPDVDSPRAHADLLSRIRGRGAVVSEVPPGRPPRRELFLVRNRLIAALAPVTLVVQASARSGALNTARQAAGLHRVVMAVPGSVRDGAHNGCHALISDQVACLAAAPADVVGMLEPLAVAVRRLGETGAA